MNCPITRVIREFFDAGKHQLLEKEIAKKDRRINIRTTTSGDTGERIKE